MSMQLDLSAFGPEEQFAAFALLGPKDSLDAGWIPPERRTKGQKDAHKAILAEMPKFAVTGSFDADVEKAVLWDCSKIANNGQHYPVFRQVTGSCVGNGGGQAVWYLSAVEVVRLKDPEQVLLPFYLLPYGRSRFHGGMRGRGEGSFGSAFAKAIRVDGILPFDDPALPKPDMRNGISWGRAVELEWSDGARIGEEWLGKSRKHLVRTTAECKSADDVRAGLQNYYPATIASDWGGQMRPAAQGTPPVILNRRVTTWQHQMCVIGWWDHPTLGEIFYILNSWGPDAHPQPVDDAPPGGFWVAKKEIDAICRGRHGEVYAFSQFEGFPGQELDLSAF